MKIQPFPDEGRRHPSVAQVLTCISTLQQEGSTAGITIIGSLTRRLLPLRTDGVPVPLQHLLIRRRIDVRLGTPAIFTLHTTNYKHKKF